MIPLLIYAFVLVIIELSYFRLANHLNIIDKPNERSSHSRVTLLGGGVIFPIAALLYFLISGFTYPWFTLGVVIISVVSFWDDIKPLSAKIRLGVHFIALLPMFYQLGLFANTLWLIPILLVLCGGIINAYNFMDGINGITGGYSLVILLGLVWVNLFVVGFADQQFLNCVIVSLLVFNFFNFRTKAKCFAGDVGSVSIAFILIYAIGLLMLKTQDFSWVFLLMVYGIDSVLTIIHRILLKENITKPHRKHLYQLLTNELNVPHVRVSSIYMLVQALVIIGYMVVRPMGLYYVWSYIIITSFVFAFIYILIKCKWFHLHLAKLSMKIINTQLLDVVCQQAKNSPRLRMNYNFHQNPSDVIQRMLNAFQPGTYLRPHRHPDREEVFIILRGRMTLLIFDDGGNVLQRVSLSHEEGTHGAEIPKMIWHTVIINETDTVMYELKRGPYEPLAKEHFAPWAPELGDSENIGAFFNHYDQ